LLWRFLEQRNSIRIESLRVEGFPWICADFRVIPEVAPADGCFDRRVTARSGRQTKEETMTTSTYLIRITRLLVLCAVVAGTTATVAGAYDAGPMSYGERWQGVDQNYRGETSNVPTPQGLKADGLRWQGIAKVYRDLGPSGHGPTAQGLRADGLRWQGIAKVYADLGEPEVSAATASVHPDDRAGPLGIGSQTASQPSVGLRPDDRSGIRGVGSSEPVTPSLRPDDRPGPLGTGVVEVAPVPSGDSFDWGDAGIGVAAGIGLALGLAGALLLALHRLPRARRTSAAATG
jgi:hypothetical protein